MVVVLKFFAWLFAALPEGAALALGRGLGRFFGVVVRRNRERALENLQLCFPELPEAERRAIVRRMFANLGMNTVEMLRWLGGREEELRARITVENAEEMDRALAGGRGAAVLTAHMGNWDLLAMWAASIKPLTIISKEIKNAGVNRYWMERRSEAQVRILAAHNSYRQCLKVLKSNELLGFILDQNMTRHEGIFVEFFGRPACTTPGLAMLAGHGQSPVVPVFMFREADGRHRVRVLPAIPPPPDRKPETLAAATQQYTKIIEDVIRAAPDQWIWMHRRWRTQPKPAASVVERAAGNGVQGTHGDDEHGKA